MKFIHLADLHIGKTLNSYSMIEDQKFALEEIINLVKKEDIKYMVIAGDVYQNSVPSAEAVNLLDYFITTLSDLEVTILMISGNHDSPDRLAFASSVLKNSNIYISNAYKGDIEKISLKDEFGNINFYLFPYIKPYHVKKYYPDEEIHSYSDAIRTVIDNIHIDEKERNVIISHQFILNAETSDSEEIYAGEAEAVADIYYDKFDYSALGHLHKKQKFLGGKIRYPGSLLKYSASEVGYKKSISIVELREKGNLIVTERKINYLRDMRKIKGYFDDILKNADNDKNRDDYIHIELEDKEEIFEGHSRLKAMYPNIMTFRYINHSIGDNNIDSIKTSIDIKSPLELFEDFYFQRKGEKLSDEKRLLLKKSIDKIWGE